MNYTEAITKTAEEKFNITSVKPFQMLVMHRILEQEDCKNVRNQLVILPTGTGKSLCFLLPASVIKAKTIIIYPLLALMNDQMTKLKQSGIDCVTLRGGQTKEQRKEIFSKLRHGTQIIITNPETLNQKGIVQQLKKMKIGLLVVDEAHIIAQWGNTFRPAYKELRETVKMLNAHQILAFTATASENTVEEISTCLFTSKPLVVRGDADRENIYYSAYPSLNTNQAVKEILSFCEKPVIVFCNSRKDSVILSLRMLREYPDIPMCYYHAGLSKTEREKLEDWFLSCHNGVLFATCAYGIGIDKPDIRTVIHTYNPDNIEEYLQESGRAGRDRKQSKAYVIITPESKGKIADVFSQASCRRIALLEALGQEKEECSGCDVCNERIIKEPYGLKQIRSFFKWFPYRYTSSHAAKLLCGNSFDPYDMKNPFWGILDYEEKDLEEVIKLLKPKGLKKWSADKLHSVSIK